MSKHIFQDPGCCLLRVISAVKLRGCVGVKTKQFFRGAVPVYSPTRWTRRCGLFYTCADLALSQVQGLASVTKVTAQHYTVRRLGGWGYSCSNAVGMVAGHGVQRLDSWHPGN